MKQLLAFALLCVAGNVMAAPQKITAVYAVTRSGQPFANVTETFAQTNVQGIQRYRIESLTSGIGVFALLGKRKLVSEGEVTEQGLRPTRFEQLQNEKKKSAADFNWNTSTVTMTAKDNSSTSAVEVGTVDLASYAYQFMFVPPEGESLNLTLTTGKKLRTYQFKASQRDEVIVGPMGNMKTVHLTNTVKNERGDEKEIWLATEQHFIPVKIIMSDETGAKLEQVLTSLSIE